MTAEQRPEMPGGKWGVSHTFYDKHEVLGVTPNNFLPFKAVMLPEGEGFKITVNGNEMTVRPGDSPVDYWRLIKGRKPPAHIAFRLIPK